LVNGAIGGIHYFYKGIVMEDRKLDITLLRGGISAERDVSLETGKQIANALRAAGHRVWESDIKPDDLAALDHKPCDLVFPALHGAFGEDGKLQTILEERGLPFVGSGAVASRMGMDKAATKSCLHENHVPTPPWQIVYKHKYQRNWTPRVGMPCAIKPIAEGSSVGCKVCRTVVEARAHLEGTLPVYGAMLVEKFIDGYELTVGILDGRTLPVIWIKPATAFYDYEAKYSRNDTQYVFDIPLPEKVMEEVRWAAAATHRHIGCRHLSRVDVMVDRATHAAYVLEVNTMPGFTSHSLVPKAAKQAGIEFSDLCERLARMALRDGRMGKVMKANDEMGVAEKKTTG
jgi:D-alanine-D-alanine ligase